MKKKILLIGGTGTISTSISELLGESEEWELYLLNRGNRAEQLSTSNYQTITCDIHNEADAKSALGDLTFDVVADFIAFTPEHLERDYRLFNNRTQQFIFISSASIYESPPSSHVVTETTKLSNPFWEYSRNKIACENYLMERFQAEAFPVTIVRPSHTYNKRSIPLGVHGDHGSWSIVKRIMEDKPVIIHGDGTSLWTMTHASDFARAFVGLLGNEKAIGEAFQITSDETLSWNQIYQYMADAVGMELKAVRVPSEFLAACSNYDLTGSLWGDKAHSAVFDNSKLKSLVPDFETKVLYKDGIKECIDFHLANPDFQQADPKFDQWCDKVILAIDAAKHLLNASSE